MIASESITSEKQNFKVEVLAEGLRNPWGMVRLPDGRLLVTERTGSLRVITSSGLLPEEVGGLPAVFANGQGGLLDIELHPDYDKNGWIYLAYSDPRGETSLTKIIRGRLRDMQFVDQETIFEAPQDEYSKGRNHFGCRLVFDGKGHLFFSIGDRGDMKNGQSLENVKGKVLRIRDDGAIPTDNPFPAERARAIWSYGNRNAQGLAMHPVTGKLWETEHGPRGGDELNVIERGRNYGWPAITYGINYNGTPITDKTESPGMEQPIFQWTPSIGICGIDFYTGDKFPAWRNNLFVSALAHQKLLRLEIDEKTDRVTHQEALLERSGRIRDVRCFDDGFVYVVYDQPGKVIRLVPSDA